MTFTTPNGIRYPNDPTAYADIITFFREMAEDVDTKFIPKSGSTAMTGTLTARSFTSNNGGTSQSATVLQTGPSPSSAFIFYDDAQKIDGTDGRRLWIAGGHGTDVAIRTRSGAERLNRISMSATTLDIAGAVTVNGTLNVTGQQTVKALYEINTTLLKEINTFSPVPNAAGFTFVAPPSGSVIIGYGAMLPAYNTKTILSYTIKTGASVGNGTEVLAVKQADLGADQPPRQAVATNGVTTTGVQYYSVYTAWLQTGLVPGDPYNIKPYYLNANSQDLTMYRHYFIVTPDL